VDAALDLADRICANSPLAVRASLRAVRSLEAEQEPDGWIATESASRTLRGTEDLQEGLMAFFEKRPAIWKGR
jgi:enoyl-CoA hydratase